MEKSSPNSFFPGCEQGRKSIHSARPPLKMLSLVEPSERSAFLTKSASLLRVVAWVLKKCVLMRGWDGGDRAGILPGLGAEKPENDNEKHRDEKNAEQR